jgi:hypothetical protein
MSLKLLHSPTKQYPYISFQFYGKDMEKLFAALDFLQNRDLPKKQSAQNKLIKWKVI